MIYRAHREVLCHNSTYFKAAFNGSFKEARTGELTLTDAEPAHFTTFLNWAYTGIIELEDGSTSIKSENLDEFISLYLFADKYDSKTFREQILNSIIHWVDSMDVISRGMNMPQLADFARVFNSLPENSPLYKFFFDVCVQCATPNTIEVAFDWYRQFPANVVANALYYHAWRLPTDLRWRANLCQYHEHVNDEEKSACKSKRVTSPERRYEHWLRR
jgi:hypothetical protein